MAVPWIVVSGTGGHAPLSLVLLGKAPSHGLAQGAQRVQWPELHFAQGFACCVLPEKSNEECGCRAKMVKEG